MTKKKKERKKEIKKKKETIKKRLVDVNNVMVFVYDKERRRSH